MKKDMVIPRPGSSDEVKILRGPKGQRLQSAQGRSAWSRPIRSTSRSKRLTTADWTRSGRKKAREVRRRRRGYRQEKLDSNRFLRIHDASPKVSKKRRGLINFSHSRPLCGSSVSAVA